MPGTSGKELRSAELLGRKPRQDLGNVGVLHSLQKTRLLRAQNV
jgi:hypothetical protein